MKSWRKILSVWSKTEPTERNTETIVDAEPVFSCDSRKQLGYFNLKRGKWAGKWVAKLKCCENPRCDCGDIDFYCAIDDGLERPPVLHFAIDPMNQTIATNHDKERHEDSAALAEAMAAEFGEEEWRILYRYLLTRKRKALRDMNVAKLQAPSSPSMMTEGGELVRFADIFPFAQGYEFDLDGEHWMTDDQYCVMPNCDCREVVLSFLHLVPSADGGTTVKEPVSAAGYDYKSGMIRSELKPAAGEPSLDALVSAVRAANPTLGKDVELRHNQLKLLYARALLKAERGRLPPVATPAKMEMPVKAKPKVGRNKPCPCGSGKKYKKCCGSIA